MRVAKLPEELEAEAKVRAHLRQQMEERDIDQAELASLLDTTEATVSRILSGDRGIGLGLFVRICRRLGVTATRLLEHAPPVGFSDDEYEDRKR